MEVFKKRGSKERLLEMMQGVNKVKININESILDDGILEKGLEHLKRNTLKSIKTVMQNIDDASYVGINGYDSENNMYNFNFKIIGSESEQDNVYNVQDVILENFYYQNNQGKKIADYDEEDLSDFNKRHGSELYDIIDNYMGYETNPKEVDENVDKKEDSQPFGGSKQEYQDGMGYGDEKPVNAKLRVKAPELEKFVKEGKFKDFDGIMKWVEEEMDVDLEDEENKEETPELDMNGEDNDQIGNNSDDDTEVPALDIDDVDNDGDQLEGGLGDDADVMQFDPQQIIKGIEVEMEHTKDPKVALEITMDHLKELPDYYTRLEAMEKEGEIDHETLTCPDKEMGSPIEFASKLASADSDEEGNPIPSIDPNFSELSQYVDNIQDADKELEDTLLGFNNNTPNKLKDDEQ